MERAFVMHRSLKMFWRSSPRKMAARLAALEKSQAMIEFRPDGTVLTANAKFLDALGYSLGEIVGRHHGLFVGREDQAERRM